MNLLNKSSLATELGRSRCYVSAMIRSGYRMQYGTRTTLRHALRWLEEHSDFVTTEVYPDLGLDPAQPGMSGRLALSILSARAERRRPDRQRGEKRNDGFLSYPLARLRRHLTHSYRAPLPAQGCHGRRRNGRQAALQRIGDLLQGLAASSKSESVTASSPLRGS